MTLVTARAYGLKPRMDQKFFFEALFWATASLVSSATMRVILDRNCFATRMPADRNPRWWKVDRALLVFMIFAATFLSGYVTQFPEAFSTVTGILIVGSVYALLPMYLVSGYLYLHGETVANGVVIGLRFVSDVVNDMKMFVIDLLKQVWHYLSK
jgi:hypothetical protein